MQPHAGTPKRKHLLGSVHQTLRLLSQALNGDARSLATDALPQFCDTPSFGDHPREAFHITSARGK